MSYQCALMVVYKPAQYTLLQRLIGFMQQLSRAGDNVLVGLGKTPRFLRLFSALCVAPCKMMLPMPPPLSRLFLNSKNFLLGQALFWVNASAALW